MLTDLHKFFQFLLTVNCNKVTVEDPTTSQMRRHTTLAYCGQTAGWIKMSLDRQIGLGPSGIVLHRDPAPLPKRRHSPPQFSAHVYCRQTARWIKMPLGMEIGLGTGHILINGDSASPSQKGTQHPNFRPMSIVAKRLGSSKCHLVGR